MAHGLIPTARTGRGAGMLRPSRAADPAPLVHPTRRRLIEETARQIRAGGIEGVNVDRVLAVVGVTKGSLYHHFPSVNDLFLAGLLEAFEDGIRESEDWARAMRDECRSVEDVRDHLRMIIRTSQVPERSWSRSLRVHALSLSRTQPQLAEDIARLQAGLTDTVTDVFSRFKLRGWIREDVDPRALAVLIQAMTLGRIVDDVVDGDHRVGPAEWISLVDDLFNRYFVTG